MAAYSNFRSSDQIDAERQELRDARNTVLEKAKGDYERSERRREKARQAGEGTWMLSSVTERIEKEQKTMEKVKEKKKKDKKKKKKHKKEKKRKRKSSSSSDTESSEDEAAWVEKGSEKKPSRPVSGPSLQRESWMESPLVTDIIPTITRAELREKKRGEDMEREEAAKRLEQPGQHTRELNPYWKEGGTGLPENRPAQTDSPSMAGDGGLSWLRKAHERCQQQAKEEGRSLEDVAAERYGSLEKLTSMIAEAGGSSSSGSGSGWRRQGKKFSRGWSKPLRHSRSPDGESREPGGAERRREGGRQHNDADAGKRGTDRMDRGSDTRGYERRGGDREGGDRGERDGEGRDREGGDRGERDGEGREREGREREGRDREGGDRGERDGEGRDREGGDRGERDGEGRDRGERDWEGRERDREGGARGERDREREERDRGRRDRDRRDRPNQERDHRDWRDSTRSSTGESQDKAQPSAQRRFIRPNHDSDDEPSHPRKRTFMKPEDRQSQHAPSVSSLKGRFARPNNSDDDDDDDNGFAESRRQASSRGDRQQKSSGGWRKKPLPQTGREEAGRRGSESREGRRKRSPSSSSQSDSSSSSSGSGSEAEEEGRSSGRREEEAAPVVKMLSEDEMNSLGARILRAELMGDEDMARQLKSQLEQAQKAKESAATKAQGSEVTPSSKPSGRAGEEDEEKVVVLTRTGRDGMVRPLPEQEFGLDKGCKKKRRKQKNVKTHSGDGKRARYFDDDDRHDLKTLVQMEKLGTAEDQNAMFSRLAGKSTERTDEDFQVDDVFVSKAARQQSGARNEEKERSKAIFEHRKVSAAMEKCQLCFNNIPKHLLIAIGSKVYLSLPAHRSLTPGHCLIVPMQHVSAATALDEDVWQEIQTFRKHLVQMFVAQDQDIVFMETTMHLRHFPHMALECIPLDREVGDLAPIYFKKAMQDAGPEWSSNKKVVELSRKDIRHSVPKGFPYFSVDFGLQGGYAHVIEDEKTFPSYFGREIVGGMIDAEPGLWRKPHREGFEDQRQKVLEFEKLWKPYDFTNPS